MECKEIWLYIVIPIICALLSGGLTLFGVWMTIIHENKKNLKNQKLVYKPYLIITNEKTQNIVYCKTPLRFDQINKDTEFYFCYLIENFSIRNSTNAECLLKELIINDVKYQLTENFLLKNSLVTLDVSRNIYVNKIDPITKIELSATDVLGNTYIYKCNFKEKIEKDNFVYDENNQRIFKYNYKINSIELPKEKLD